jgi:hypothetical protein
MGGRDPARRRIHAAAAAAGFIGDGSSCAAGMEKVGMERAGQAVLETRRSAMGDAYAGYTGVGFQLMAPWNVKRLLCMLRCCESIPPCEEYFWKSPAGGFRGGEIPRSKLQVECVESCI